MENAEFRDELVRNLSRLYEEGGDGNYLVVSAPPTPYYVQVAAQRGDSRGRLEAVSNAFLEGPHALDEAAVERVLEFGLSVPEGRANHGMEFEVGTPGGRLVAAELTLRLFVDVYQVDLATVNFDLNLDRRWRLTNPRLRDARASGDKKRLLTELAAAVVLMPHVSGRGLEGVHRTPEGEVVFFTEEAAIAPYAESSAVSAEGSVAPCAELLEWLGRQAVIFDPGSDHAFSLSGDEVLQLLAIAGRA